jgi:hypothetical protein
MNLQKKIIIFHIFLVTLFSCQGNKSKLQDTIVSWQDKYIEIPKTLKLVNGDKDSASNWMRKNGNKLIAYYDNAGCTECKLRLNDWNDIFNEVVDSSFNVSIVFIVQPPKVNTSELKQIFKDYRFYYPVYIDSLNKFRFSNKISSNPMLHVFLLNSQNKIVLIGTPIQNEKMWKLYKDYFTKRVAYKDLTNKATEKNYFKNTNTKNISIPYNSINIGKVPINSKRNISFPITNNDDNPLIITNVESSCGCLISKYDKNPILKGKKAKIDLILNSNSVGYFSKTVDVVCNVTQGAIRLTVAGTVVK